MRIWVSMAWGSAVNDSMSRNPALLLTITLLFAFGLTQAAQSQCKNQITLVPLHAVKAAGQTRNFVRFRYSLSTSDSLLIESHEDTETTIGPFDTGFLITRNGKTIKSALLRKLPEFLREEPDYSEAFTTLAVTRACTSEGPIYFVSMQYMGDLTSPTLFFTVVPSTQGYEVSTLPMISGGVAEVSTPNPLHLRTWDNLHEGQCEACETAYRITEYEIRDGKPIRTRAYRTRRLYTSGNYIFDDRRRIRFSP